MATTISELESLIVVGLSAIILTTLVGNLLVCLSVILVRRLRRPPNYLLISLAISDLCVAILVMPLALYYEFEGSWPFGTFICDLWISLDVLCCTASILNLCMISVDRYMAITKPLTYGVKRTSKRILLLIVLVWLISSLITVPPLLIFGNDYGTQESPQCVYSSNIIYQFYATLGAFYIPLLVMVSLYYKIYASAKLAIQSEQRSQASSSNSLNKLRVSSSTLKSHVLVATATAFGGKLTTTSNPVTVVERVVDNSSGQSCAYKDVFELKETTSVNKCSKKRSTLSNKRPLFSSCVQLKSSLRTLKKTKKDDQSSKSDPHCYNPETTLIGPRSSANSYVHRKRNSGSAKRVALLLVKERKASITLGVIMTAFVACWLPFFVLALLRPLGFLTDLPKWVTSFALWLGFANSMLNPIIYVTFHRDFRKAFGFLLCFQCNQMNTRMRDDPCVGLNSSQKFSRMDFENEVGTARNQEFV